MNTITLQGKEYQFNGSMRLADFSTKNGFSSSKEAKVSFDLCRSKHAKSLQVELMADKHAHVVSSKERAVKKGNSFHKETSLTYRSTIQLKDIPLIQEWITDTKTRADKSISQAYEFIDTLQDDSGMTLKDVIKELTSNPPERSEGVGTVQESATPATK